LCSGKLCGSSLRFWILKSVVLVLVVVATVYENSLASQGLGLDNQEQMEKKSSLVDTKCGSKDTDRLEMNHMNNNNNNDADCEPEKLKTPKLGSLLCREMLDVMLTKLSLSFRSLGAQKKVSLRRFCCASPTVQTRR
jgi:hypothetical protein